MHKPRPVDYSHVKRPTPPTFKQVLTLVKHHYNVTDEYLINTDRNNYSSTPRHVAMWAARKGLAWKWDAVAAKFNRTRATVMRNVQKVEDMRDEDPAFKELTDSFENQLRQF